MAASPTCLLHTFPVCIRMRAHRHKCGLLQPPSQILPVTSQSTEITGSSSQDGETAHVPHQAAVRWLYPQARMALTHTEELQ